MTTTATTYKGESVIITEHIRFDSQGHADIVNLTTNIRNLLAQTELVAGTATIFVPGATGALTTLEFEPGVVQDFQDLFDRLAPVEHPYNHNITHPDLNGHAHIRAGLLGPSLVVPFDQDGLCLGRWQEICFLCFDNRPRQRTVIVQFVGVAR
jgi:secondary thiamine-phosphate synthase enzyme